MGKIIYHDFSPASTEGYTLDVYTRDRKKYRYSIGMEYSLELAVDYAKSLIAGTSENFNLECKNVEYAAVYNGKDEQFLKHASPIIMWKNQDGELIEINEEMAEIPKSYPFVMVFFAAIVMAIELSKEDVAMDLSAILFLLTQLWVALGSLELGLCYLGWYSNKDEIFNAISRAIVYYGMTACFVILILAYYRVAVIW